MKPKNIEEYTDRVKLDQVNKWGVDTSTARKHFIAFDECDFLQTACNKSVIAKDYYFDPDIDVSEFESCKSCLRSKYYKTGQDKEYYHVRMPSNAS